MILHYYTKEEGQALMNDWSGASRPFLFMISYDQQQNILIPLDEVDRDVIKYNFEGNTNDSAFETESVECVFKKNPISFDQFRKSFDRIEAGLHRGDSFLCNLTCETPVECNLSAEEIYMRTKARYKLWLKDHFVVFSPEIFVKIEKGIIRSFPMKGTISASLPDAQTRILNDVKESAEHATIVDLIRNDLSSVAFPVWVERYRYTDRLITSSGEILQVSSEVCGKINDISGRLGDILYALLPAGSITGAPKPSTCRIISEAETHKRGFYTGVCGIFDGKDLNSAVMIRFIEDREGKLFFKSGGGITTKSDAESEYEELIQKVYVSVY